MSSATESPTTGRPERADARRNRDAVLSAARRLFASAGTEASMPAIAAAAGVAVGTIYRHYPSKEQLIEAVVIERLRAIVRIVEAVLSAPSNHPFAVFFQQVAALCVEDGRFAAIVSEVAHTSTAGRDASQQLQQALTRLLDAAADCGELRVRLEPADIPILLAGVRRAAQQQDPARWERYIGVVLHGVCNASAPEGAGDATD